MHPGCSAGGYKRQTGLNKAPVHLTLSEWALILRRPERLLTSTPAARTAALSRCPALHTGAQTSGSWTCNLQCVLSPPHLPNPTGGLALGLPSHLRLSWEQPPPPLCRCPCPIPGREGSLGPRCPPGRWTGPLWGLQLASDQCLLLCTGPPSASEVRSRAASSGKEDFLPSRGGCGLLEPP